MITSELRPGSLRLLLGLWIAAVSPTFADDWSQVQSMVREWGLTPELEWDRLPQHGMSAAKISLPPLEKECPSIACRPARGGSERFRLYPDAEWEAWTLLHPWPRIEAEVEQWSVAEKYDLTVADPSFSLAQALRNFEATPASVPPLESERAWIAASIMFAEIPHGVQMKTAYPIEVRWSADDLKQLFVHQVRTSLFPVQRITGSPTLGPAELHALLATRLGLLRQALALEWVDSGLRQVRMVKSFQVQVLSETQDSKILRTTLQTLDAYGKRAPLVLEYELRSDSGIAEILNGGTWTSLPHPIAVWAPAPKAKMSSGIESVVSPKLGELGSMQFARWAAAVSRQGKVLCAVAASLYEKATATETEAEKYPCEPYSSTTP